MKNPLVALKTYRKPLIALLVILAMLIAILAYVGQKYIQNAYVTGAPRPLIIGAKYDNFGKEGDEEEQTDEEQSGGTKDKSADDYGDLSLDALKVGDEIVQSFETSNISAFAVLFTTRTGHANVGSLRVALRELPPVSTSKQNESASESTPAQSELAQGGQIVYDGRLDLTKYNYTYDIRFDLPARIRTDAPRRYELVITADELAADDIISVASVTDDIPAATLTLNDKTLPANLNFRVYGENPKAASWYLALGILLVAILIAAFLLMRAKKVRIGLMYLVVTLAFGVLYLFVFPPNVAPDEGTHFLTTYQLADKALGIQSTEDESFMIREEDRAHESTFFHYPNHTSYENYAQSLTQLHTDAVGEKLVDNTIFMSPDVPYEFFPQTLGFVIARLLKLTVAWQYLLGRFFNLLLFALIIFLAIERTPIGKAVFACVSMFPMSMEIASSLSYDVFIIAFAFLGLAEYLHIAYGNEYAKIWDLIALNLVLFLLGPTKAVYVTMFLLAFLIPKKYFAERRHLLIYRSAVALVFIAACAITLKINLSVVTDTGSRGVSREEELFSMHDLLADPLNFIKMSFYTTAVRISDFAYMMIGKKLGWIDIPIRNYVIWGFFLAACLSAVHMRIGDGSGIRHFGGSAPAINPSGAQLDTGDDEPPTIGKRDRILFPIAFIGSYIGMLIIFFIAWTKVNSPVIEGLQGRYLTPVLPLLLLLLNGKKVARKRLTDKHILLFVSFLQCTVLITVFQVIICR